MRASATEVIRRGFNSTLGNWPVIAIRIAENVLFAIVMVVSAIAAIVPLIVSLGINKTTVADPSDVPEVVFSILEGHWVVLLYLLGLVSLVLLVLVMVHSFVVAGCARIFVDAERKAAAIAVPTWRDMAAFDAEIWLRGGMGSWWPVFWIFNVAWGVAALLMLAPLLVFVVLALLAQSSPAAAIGIGCFGLVVTLLFAIAVGVVTSIWTQKAIVVCVARRSGAIEALGYAWRDFRDDASRHLAVAVVILAVLFAGSMFLGLMSAVAQPSHHSPGLMFTFMPVQIFSSFANSIFSAAVGAWLLASFAALTTEPRR